MEPIPKTQLGNLIALALATHQALLKAKNASVAFAQACQDLPEGYFVRMLWSENGETRGIDYDHDGNLLEDTFATYASPAEAVDKGVIVIVVPLDAATPPQTPAVKLTYGSMADYLAKDAFRNN